MQLIRVLTLFSLLKVARESKTRWYSTSSNNWHSWGEWSKCSVTCDTGTQSRTRECRVVSCRGHADQRRSCTHGNCPGRWSHWSHWTSCTASCGGGTEMRMRYCLGYYGCEGLKQQSHPCNLPPCGDWNLWSQWGECNKLCDGGRKTRSRTCTTDGGCNGPTDETVLCNLRSCCTQWMAWSICSVTCISPSQTAGIEKRRRNCIDKSMEELEERRCTNPSPVRCPVWAPWSAWSSCSVTCGEGRLIRNRHCATRTPCPGPKTESKPCRLEACCGPWTDWTLCSVTCTTNQRYPGTQMRRRRCGPDVKTEDRSCQPQSPFCPNWNQWLQWSPCSKSCDQGFRIRKRTCTESNSCRGHNEEIQKCNNQGCPNWNKWTQWTDCDRSCGAGTRTRKRSCTYDRQYCTADRVNTAACICYGNAAETKICSAQNCAQWTKWEHWQSCSAQCNGGRHSRMRKCIKDQAFCTDSRSTDPSCACPGKGFIEEACNQQRCAYWGNWGVWARCSSSCQGGSKIRKRTCLRDKKFCTTSPERNSGSCQCPGLEVSNAACNRHQCPNWAQWAPWGACDKPCNGGQRTRRRDCITDPIFCRGPNAHHISCKCSGPDAKLVSCNDFQCQLWAQWQQWEHCDCNNGTKQRIRKCAVDEAHCGKDAIGKVGCECSGRSIELTECMPNDCKDNATDQWGSWGSWSECSELCGGTRTRERQCQLGECVGLAMETASCPEQVCATWNEWSLWSPCSASCGKGIETRIRLCPLLNACKPGVSTQNKDCISECDYFGQWTDWSECSVTCGEGVKMRSRTNCVSVEDKCPDKEHEEKICIQSPCEYNLINR